MRRVVVLFFSRLFPVLVLAVISIVYSRHLSLEDYGQFQTAWMYSSAFAVVLAFGFPALILSQKTESVHQLLSLHRTPIALLYTGLLAVLILIIAYSGLPDYVQIVCIATAVVQALSIAYESILVKQNREPMLLFTGAVYSSVLLVWHCIVVLTSFDLILLLTGTFVLQSIRMVVLFMAARKMTTADSAQVSNPALQQWLFLGWNETVNVTARWLDKLVLIYFISAADFALFFNGTYEVPFAPLLVSAAGNLITVQCAGTQDNQEKLRHFRSGYILLSALLFPLFALLLFFGADFFRVLFAEKYMDALPLFYVSLLLLPLRTNSYTPILQTAGKADIILKGSLIDLALTSILVIILYHSAGLTGAAFAVVIATYTQAGYYLFHSAKILNVPVAALIPIRLLLTRLLIALLLFAAVNLATANMDWKIRLGIAGTLATVLIVLSCLYMVRNQKIKFPSASAFKQNQ